MEKTHTENVSLKFTAEKAGMEGLNREEINRIITEATKNTRIAKKTQEEYEQLKIETSKMVSSLAALHKNEILYKQIQQAANSKVAQLQSQKRLDKIWMHLDMDMFFAAVEIRDKPSLATLPIAVGSIQMIATSNYVARKMGVRSAMPGFLALKLCPQLQIIPVAYEKYQNESKKIMVILKKYDAYSEQIGLDEAYLDLTEYCQNNNATNEEEIKGIVQRIKDEIYAETRLTCSCGIACNKTLAKIGSDYNKPNGIFYLQFDYDYIANFMKDLKIRKIPFIGEKTEQRLNILNIFKCEDIIKSYVDIFYLFESRFDFFYNGAIGIGNYVHEEVKDGQSISRSASFHMTNVLSKINTTYNNLARKLHSDMVNDNVQAKTIAVEVIDNKERKISKSNSRERYFITEEDIIQGGKKILENLLIRCNGEIRMIRIRVSGLKKNIHVDETQIVKNWFNFGFAKDKIDNIQEEEEEENKKEGMIEEEIIEEIIKEKTEKKEDKEEEKKEDKEEEKKEEKKKEKKEEKKEEKEEEKHVINKTLCTEKNKLPCSKTINKIRVNSSKDNKNKSKKVSKSYKSDSLMKLLNNIKENSKDKLNENQIQSKLTKKTMKKELFIVHITHQQEFKQKLFNSQCPSFSKPNKRSSHSLNKYLTLDSFFPKTNQININK